MICFYQMTPGFCCFPCMMHPVVLILAATILTEIGNSCVICLPVVGTGFLLMLPLCGSYSSYCPYHV